MLELTEKNFCDGFEMKWDTASWCTRHGCERRFNPCFTFGYWLQARIYKSVFHHHQLPHGAQTSGKGQASHGMNSPAFTIYTRDGQTFANCVDSKVTNHSVCQQHTYFYQARKHGGEASPKNFSPHLEKCLGHS